MARSRFHRRLVLGFALLIVGLVNLAQVGAGWGAHTEVAIGNALSVERATPDLGPDRGAVPTVRILAEGCGSGLFGSGTVLPGGRVLTARHVVETAVDITIEDDHGNRYRADAVIFDGNGRDAALLTVRGLSDPGADVTTESAGVGAAVAVIGHPQGGARHTDLGRVSSFTTQAPVALDGHQVMLLDTMFAEGMSGGPVVDSRDRVVGVAVGVERYGRVGIVVPTFDLADLLAGFGSTRHAAC